jgi:hypothetical protein
MPCAYCQKEKGLTKADCGLCGLQHEFCKPCITAAKRRDEKAEKTAEETNKAKKRATPLASLKCHVKLGKMSRAKAEKVKERAKDNKDALKRLKPKKECPKKEYAPPLDAVIDRTALGPSDPADIANDPIKYVHIRANEIWKANPKLFDNTTGGVTIIECGDAKTRSVILTSSCEGFNPLAELGRQAKEGEILVPPDPVAHRVRNNLTELQKSQGVKKEPDAVFIARLSGSNPAKQAGIENVPGYVSAEASASSRDPKYTITSTFPGPDANETHAERRANAFAAKQGCTVIAQAPTLGCCDKCQTSLGIPGLAKVPEQRRTGEAYNEYRRKILRPTEADSHKMNTS